MSFAHLHGDLVTQWYTVRLPQGAGGSRRKETYAAGGFFSKSDRDRDDSETALNKLRLKAENPQFRQSAPLLLRHGCRPRPLYKDITGSLDLWL